MGLAFLILLGFLSLRAPGFFASANLRDLLVSSAPVLVAATMASEPYVEPEWIAEGFRLGGGGS